MKPKIVFLTAIISIFEWYDYALFGQLAYLIGEKFFPSSSAESSLLIALLAFAAGYLIRPLGGVLFGVLGDKYGRKFSLSLSVFLMAFPTAIIGFIPSYESIGIYASIIMVGARILQGLSIGGALTGSVSFIIEHTNIEKRSFAGSFPMAGICLGILLGALSTSLFKSLLSHDEFLDWGWRCPFIVGVFVMYLGLYIKKYTAETPEFTALERSNKIVHAPLKEVLRTQKTKMLISILINATGSVLFYIQAIYLTNYFKINNILLEREINFITNISYLIMAFVCLSMGYIADKIGKVRIYKYIIICVLIFSYPIFAMIQSGNYTLIFLAELILGVLAASYIGPEPALQAEFYSPELRNTALSVSYNVATTIFGGLTPYIVGAIVVYFNEITVISYYLIFTATLSSVGIFYYDKKNR